jgi:hypothetical protein
MWFKRILFGFYFGLLFVGSAWAQPSNWAVWVPAGAQSNGSGSADFYSYYVNNHFFCSLWDKSGIDHFHWTCCCAGNPGFLDPADPPYAYFDSYSIAGNYYDCDGQLLQSGAVGFYMIVSGTGNPLSGGIGGPGTYPACILSSMDSASPASECRVYADMTPVKRSPNYCTSWP